ncbi:MAG TPA: lipoxygenase family protein [Candidatus Bathyarchaeia archaeon]|nr:lipoxygenase family protein [Candidatus Bathyarchaeia archaeon]
MNLWPLRRRFWNALAIMKFRANRPAVIPVPGPDGRCLEAVSVVRQFPGIPLFNVRVADAVPPDEAHPLNQWFYKFQVAMYRLFSPMQAGLPPIDADPQAALAAAYTPAHRRVFPMPVLPPEYSGRLDLGLLAVAGPYACYLERAPDGGYQWDLRALAGYEHHAGLHSLGVRVRFRANRSAQRLEVVGIDSELGTSAPGDPGWDLATRLALAAVTTHVSLIRHFNGVHLAAGGSLAIATRNALPADHPLRRLLWPHMFGTQYSNQLVTRGQMSAGGDFETIFSFTHRGMCRLFADTWDAYDISVLHPARDAERRGLVGAGFETPALDNRRAHFDVMRAHAHRYLRLYYASDAALQEDARVVAWTQALDGLVPNGVSKILGPRLTLDGAADLIGSFIYMASVEHEILGTGLWNYQMWSHIQPVRVYRNGQRVPLDVYQRLVNANFNLNVSRAPLVQDWSYLALDERGAAAFRVFRDELRALQARLDTEPPALWKMAPRILEANINA